jgi:hypothetical protein
VSLSFCESAWNIANKSFLAYVHIKIKSVQQGMQPT